MMEGYKIDHVGSNNPTKIKEQMKKNSEILALSQEIKKNIDMQYEDVLRSITPERLSQIIYRTFVKTDGSWQTSEQIKQHPSYVLLTQLCLDMIGYHSTSIDAHYGRETQSAVAQFEGRNHIKIDGLADVEFFKAIQKQLGMSLVSLRLDAPITNQMPKDATMLASVTESALLGSHRETLQQQNISKRFDEILGGTPYKSIKKEFISFADVASLRYGLKIDEHHIKRIFNLIKKENGSFYKGRTSYTPIGQVGKLAWSDAFKKGLNIKPPQRSKTNRTNQLLATYGYMKLAGVFDAINDSQLGSSYAKYNLGLYHNSLSEIKRIGLFSGQASEMKQYATNNMNLNNRKSLAYDDIVYAEFMYYAPDVDKQTIS